MKPTDDDGGIPDDTQDDLVAQIVPLRRPQDDTEHREQPHDEPQAAVDDTDDWSVFDPPEDLQLAERPRRDQPDGSDSDHDLTGADPERPWTSTPRLRNRLVAFAGVALTTVAIAVLAVLTLKGHAGASPRQHAALTPSTGLTSASRAHAVPQGGSPASQHRRGATRPSHHKPAQRRPSTRRLPHTATAGTPTGEGISAGRRSVEPTPTHAQSEPSSSSGTSAARGTGSEFGFER